jgi:glutathione S-transferase
MELVVGTKAWSTWSMRPWLVLKHTGAPFAEVVIALRQENGISADRIQAHSPSGLVPVLNDGDLTIWDTLAICEYLAERYPGLWPTDPVARALARSATAEMHSGFQALRAECPMALEIAPKVVELSEPTQKNIGRIVTLWSDMLTRFGGPFLGGAWSIADAFYTPVASRFETYGVNLADYGDSGLAAAYGQRLLQTPEYLAWREDALA